MSIINELFGLPDDDWMREAVCTQTDVEAFFPEGGSSAALARRVCLGCPVRSDCLKWAMDTDERYGVLGGMTERERARLRNGINPLRRGARKPNGHGFNCHCCRRAA